MNLLSFDLLNNGLLNLSAWEYVGITLLLTHITIASVTIFLHRNQAHGALTLHPAISHFFRFWLWLTSGTVTKEWVAIHRKHHAKCETKEDPHSPQIEGIKKVLFEGRELYHAESLKQATLDKYGNGTPNDWLERNLYSRHRNIGIALMLFIDLMLFGAIGLTIFAVQMLWIPFWAAGVINGIGHYWGYRDFETPDASTNIIPWGILIGGEELHNNHHAHASSAKLSTKWWEFDIGWFYIQILSALKLASIKKIAPRIHTIANKQLVDIETVRAVIRNRCHILKLYGRKVIKQELRNEKRGSERYFRKLYTRVRKLMTREGIKLDIPATKMLNEALQSSKTLETVYQFKQQLKELWLKSSTNHAKRVQGLQQWCSDAEASGIQSLQDFACYLRSYTLLTT